MWLNIWRLFGLRWRAAMAGAAGAKPPPKVSLSKRPTVDCFEPLCLEIHRDQKTISSRTFKASRQETTLNFNDPRIFRGR